MLFIFPTPVLIRHLWQLKTVGSLHCYIVRAVLLKHLLSAPFNKYETGLEKLARNEHSSLLVWIVNDEEKMFYNFVTRMELKRFARSKDL
jgi:hypothetical protein